MKRFILESAICEGKGGYACIPVSVLKAIKCTHDDVAARHPAIGNSFHVPSFALILCLLLSSLVRASTAALHPCLADPVESLVAPRIEGTVFFPSNGPECRLSWLASANAESGQGNQSTEL